MNEEDIKLLKDEGWIVVCESPLELEYADDPQSTATGEAAEFIFRILKYRY